MIDQLARIDWKMGQTLLPEHFLAQEDSLIADVATRFSLLGAPFYGVGRLKWNEALLEQGILSVAKLSLILPTGPLLQIPGNAKVQSFNLNATGSTKASIYLHLTSERVPNEDDDDETADGDRLERYSHGVVLSSEQVQRGALFTMKLAEFEKGAEGSWGLSPNYIPPLLRVGTSPFLRESLEALAQALTLFQQKLQENIAASYLGGEGLSGAKTCLKALYTFSRLLANLNGQIHVHPYALSEALRVFYAEVCIYQERNPEDITSAYHHDDLAGTLGQVITPLLEHLRLQKGKAPYLPFEQRDGLFLLEELPAEARGAMEVFLLLQKPRVGEALRVDALKLASRMRLPNVHKLSLVGIPVVPIERPPFQHKFGPEVDFFQLSFGDEWDKALSEGSLAFYETPSLKDAKAFLFWRRA
ncbi:MAG: type VI secretion system baseplate subunit TssK [Planctomycetes bacterium]|nr:type VI secretion system baseplate subunit TssK [Planctomycetota bacterium]